MYKIKYLDIYGFNGAVTLFLYAVISKLIYRNVKIIRFPFEIRGRKYIKWNKGFTTGKYCRIEAYPYIYTKEIIKIGKNFQMNDSVHIGAVGKIEIGDDVLVASRVYITDICHGEYNDVIKQSSPIEIPHTRKISYKSVKIEDRVWIGEGVVILPGVIIGEGAIIGANSVVTKDIPPNSIAVGNPAIVIKKYDFKIEKWVKV